MPVPLLGPGSKIKDLTTAFPMFKVLCRKQVNREVSSSMIRAVPEKAWDPGSTLEIHLTERRLPGKGTPE